MQTITIVLLVLGAVVLVLAAFSLALSLIGLLFMLLVAGFVGWLADTIVPGELPYGFLGAALAGLVGSWIGQWLLGPLGPSLFGIRLIPALVGAIIVVAVVELVGTRVLQQKGSEEGRA